MADGIAFDLINEDTVKRLQRDGGVKLPEKKIAVAKDERWNAKQMSSKVLAGIMNGSSIADIAEAMKQVVGNNEVSAIRNTRTMVTAAENGGRLDSYKRLSEDGLVLRKHWTSTPDDRTRPTHVDIDGEEKNVNEKFSNGCMYPGDSEGPAEEVWMCRCSMGVHVVGFRRADGSISEVNYEPDTTLHDEQMAAEKERRKDTIHKMYDGTDIDTGQARQAFVDWADGVAYDIRYSQQMGHDSEEARYIEQLISDSNVHHSGELYRGIMADQDTANRFYNFLEAVENGDDVDNMILDMLGTSSWSEDKSIAEVFSKNADKMGNLDIDTDNLTPIVFSYKSQASDGLAINIDEFAGLNQKEVIVSKNANFVVDNIVVSNGGTIYVDLSIY